MKSVTLDRKIIETINLASNYPTIKRVGIFGSYIRMDSDTHNDIDLLYDYDDENEQSTDELLDYVDEIDAAIKAAANVSKVDYVWFKGVLKSQNEKFRQNVLNDVIWVYIAE